MRYEALLARADSGQPAVPTKKVESAPTPKTLNERVAKLLEAKGIPAPEIDLHIELITHATKSDADGLKKELAACDVFFPENVGATEKGIEALNRLSRGEITPKEYARVLRTEGARAKLDAEKLKKLKISPWVLLFLALLMRGFMQQLPNVIYKSNKIIGHVDIKQDHPLFEETLEKMFSEMSKNTDTQSTAPKTFSEATEFVKKMLGSDKMMKDNEKREDHMLENLAPEIARLVEQNPSLRKKKIKVLMFLGGAHTRVPRLLKAEGSTVTSYTSKNTAFPSYVVEAMQKPGMAEQVSDELARKATLSLLFEAMYLLVNKKSKNVFYPLHHHRGRALVSRVFADVFYDKADEIYTAFASKPVSEVFSKSLYRSLINERMPQLKAEVAKWVEVLKKENRA